jgi:hypothetical protein
MRRFPHGLGGYSMDFRDLVSTEAGFWSWDAGISEFERKGAVHPWGGIGLESVFSVFRKVLSIVVLLLALRGTPGKAKLRRA